MDYEALSSEFLNTMRKIKSNRDKMDLNKELRGEGHIINLLVDKNVPLLPSEMSEMTGMSSAQLSPILNNLEKKGIIKREINPDDRRQILVILTDEGYKIANAHYNKVLEFTTNQLKKLGDHDATELVRIMKKIEDLR